MNPLLDTIGYNGSYVMLLYGLYALIDEYKTLIFFIIGRLLSSILNLLLKGTIKQSRPDKIIHISVQDTTLFSYLLGYNMYGMPSGHVQNAFYITTFIYMATKKIFVCMFMLLLSLIIAIQRVLSNRHTTFQTIIGSFVGILLAYFMYSITTQIV
jgi:membrane-associated phospholipid phosphatase